MDYSYYGTKPILYYLVTYVLTQFLLFATLSILSQNKENLTIDSFKGLGWSSPVLSIILSICLLSLMGMPPLAGFFAKYMIFAIVVQKQSLLFSVLLIFSTVIAAYYYLRVFSNMYFFPAEGASEYTIDRNVKIVLAIALLSLLIIGFNPDLLLAFC
jgi:NADH-quinone oxidoreductase subunit N